MTVDELALITQPRMRIAAALILRQLIVACITVQQR